MSAGEQDVAFHDDGLDGDLTEERAGRAATPGVRREGPGAEWEAKLPAGVVTFLMSDVEGSTPLWERNPAAMADAQVRHDGLIAEVVTRNGGRFVESGDGDSTTSIFAAPSNAVRAAIEAVHALAGEHWPDGSPMRDRFGLHTGEAETRTGAHLGSAANLAARIRGEARGGEILLSATTATLAGEHLPSGYTTVRLGPHTLRGIELPQEISAVVGPGLETSPAAATCPYRGLQPFGAGDRAMFFGREEIVRAVLDRLRPGGLLAVVGASGSGKSSLLRAGVIAAVNENEVPCASRARLITPGAEPPLDLGGDPGELLVVDQFEEIYTQCADPDRRKSFIDRLLDVQGPVVIGVRADFYGEIGAHPRLAAAVAADQLLLGPMQDEDLRRAITEPARLVGLRLEPGLVDLVLRDAAGQPGTLPLISHALRETWERRDGRTLSVDAYRASGGVSSAIAHTAETVLQGTTEPERPLLRGIFLRLTELGDGVEDTRRRVRLEELIPHGSSAQTVRKLLDELAEARLITLDEGTVELAHEVLTQRWPRLRRWLEEDRQAIYLYRRLCEAARNWDTAGREQGDLYRGTRLDAALEWARTNAGLLNDTERDFLDASVEEASRLRRRQQIANRRLRRALAAAAFLLVAAAALLTFALVSRHDAVSAEASARSQALATESGTQLTRDAQLSLLLARAALASAPTPQAELAASDALDANAARSQLPSLGVQGCDSSDYMVLLDGGRTAAADTCQGDVAFADLLHGRIVRRVHVGFPATDMVLGPSARELVVASGNHLVSVDPRSGRTRRLFTAPFEIEQVASGPGRMLAIADRELIALVDPHHGTMRVIAHADASVNGVNGMMWASRRVLLVASTGQSAGRGDLLPELTALDVSNGARTTVPLVAPPRVASVVFLRVSPDGRMWFVTGSVLSGNSKEKIATTWGIDARTRTVRWTASGPAAASASPVQVSPDGRLVAVGYGTGAAEVLETATGHPVARISSSSTIASGDLALAGGDKTLVTLSLDGVLRTWSTQGSERLRLQAASDATVDFTPDGRDLVLLGSRGEIVHRSGRVLRTFPGFPAATVFSSCASCFFASPQLGRLSYLDPASQTPRVIEIEGRTGRRIANVAVPQLEAQGVAPDGRIVADYVEGTATRAELIDPGSARSVFLPPGAGEVGCIASRPAFTPDGSLMAIGDGCVHLDIWDLRSRRLVRSIVLPGHGEGTPILTRERRYVLVPVPGGTFARADLRTGAVQEVPGSNAPGTALAVSPDGRYYAIGRQDGSVDEYEAATLRLIRQHQLETPIKSLVFSPASSELAVEDTQSVVRVWDVCEICENATLLEHRAAAESVRALTADERRTFDVR